MSEPFEEAEQHWNPIALRQSIDLGHMSHLNHQVNGATFQQAPPLAWLNMATWDSEPVPERKWAIRDRVPLNQAGLFSGEGGTGKSIIELMKNVAHVAGKDWMHSLPEPGPAFYIGAEDDADDPGVKAGRARAAETDKGGGAAGHMGEEHAQHAQDAP